LRRCRCHAVAIAIVAAAAVVPTRGAGGRGLRGRLGGLRGRLGRLLGLQLGLLALLLALGCGSRRSGGLGLERGLTLSGQLHADVLELRELGKEGGLLGGDGLRLGGGGGLGRLRGVAGDTGLPLRRGRGRRASSACSVATSARVAEARNSSYLPSSASSAFCMVVARSMTVVMPSDFAMAEKAVRPGAIS
jgi:hypothetical protein